MKPDTRTRAAAVTGRCFRKTCTRKAKIMQECVLCGLGFKTCQFHRDRAHTELRQHIMTEHPAEFAAARRGDMPPVEPPTQAAPFQPVNVYTPVKR